MRQARIRLVAAACLGVLLGACGGGQSNGVNIGPQVDGYVFAAVRLPVMRRAEAARPTADPLAVQQTLLADVWVEAFTLPVGPLPFARARTNASGRFVFSLLSANGLSSGQTVLLRVKDDRYCLSTLLNVGEGATSKVLAETTHIAALALTGDGSRTSIDDATIARHERAARRALTTALGSNAMADFTAADQQAAAAQVAVEAARLAPTLPANRPPTLSNVSVSPSQLPYTGGEVKVEVEAGDLDGDPFSVYALQFRQAGDAPPYVRLTGSSGVLGGTFTLGGNATAAPLDVQFAVVGDDGINPPVPSVVRQVRLQPEGTVLLDLLSEELYAAGSRSPAACWWRRTPRVVRAAQRSRQADSRALLPGVAVAVDGQPALAGTTDASGRLFLNVPEHLLASGGVALTASQAGRTTYHQVLVVPTGIVLRAGDRVEVDLPLGSEADWRRAASELGLGTLDFARTPLAEWVGVTSGVDLSGVAFASTRFLPVTVSPRTDDGDFFAVDLAPGTLTCRGTFAPELEATRLLPFGPLNTPLAAGHVYQFSALLPPTG